MQNETRIDDLLPVKDMARRHSNVCTESSLRWEIHNAKDNGLAEAGALVRKGRRVFINVPRYLEWMLR